MFLVLNYADRAPQQMPCSSLQGLLVPRAYECYRYGGAALPGSLTVSLFSPSLLPFKFPFSVPHSLPLSKKTTEKNKKYHKS